MRIGRPSKYRAIKETVDGITFHSRREAKRYRELKLLERAGAIRELELQPKYPLMAVMGGSQSKLSVCVGNYFADFRYYTVDDGMRGIQIIEDVKSPATKREMYYRLKKRIVEANYGISITEV